MKKVDFKLSVLPHLIAVIAFLIITAFFFRPVVLGDKVLEQHDINQWEGGARELLEYREATGEEGLWTNSMFSGMPAYFVSIEWSDGPITIIKKIISLGLPHPVNNIFIAFLSYYIMLIAFGVRPYLAIGGAIAFGLSSFNIIGLAAGHNARIGAIAFMPLVIAGVHLTFTRSRILGFGLTAMATALQLMENHLQITYYLLLILVIYGIAQLVYFIKRKQIKPLLIRTGICIAAAIIAVASFAGKFWSAMEYSKYSMRGPSELTQPNAAEENTSGLGKEYAFAYSNGLIEPFTLMIPNILGGSSSNFLVQDENSETLQALRTSGDPQTANQLARYSSAYWGSQPITAPYYIGAISCFLFAIGFIYAERKYVVWLAIVTAIGIILSWGSNFSTLNYFMFDYFPGYNKFRSVTFTLVMPILAIPLLGMLGLEFLTRKAVWTKADKKRFLIAMGATGGLCLLIVLISGMFSFTRTGEEQLPRWFLDAIRSDRQSLLMSDAFRSFMFILLAAGLIWFAKLNKVNRTIMTALVSLLITIDLWSVDARYFGAENFKRAYGDSFSRILPVDQAIKQHQASMIGDRETYYGKSPRVFNLQGAWNEARTSAFHKSIGGYHGAKMRRYQDLYDYCLENEAGELLQNLRNGNRDMSSAGILNMLNAQYIYFGGEANNYLVNDSALGHAWLVGNVLKVQSPNDELLQTCIINPAEVAVIDVTKFDPGQDEFNTSGRVEMKLYSPNRLEYTANVEGTSLVVFSEIFYPVGWKATINGQAADILRVNYVLRALKIPQGEHTITFEFKPDSYIVGDKITMAGSWIVLLVFLGSVGFVFISKNKHDPEPDAV